MSAAILEEGILVAASHVRLPLEIGHHCQDRSISADNPELSVIREEFAGTGYNVQMVQYLRDHRVLWRTLTYTHVLNRGPSELLSPVDGP